MVTELIVLAVAWKSTAYWCASCSIGLLKIINWVLKSSFYSRIVWLPLYYGVFINMNFIILKQNNSMQPKQNNSMQPKQNNSMQPKQNQTSSKFQQTEKKSTDYRHHVILIKNPVQRQTRNYYPIIIFFWTPKFYVWNILDPREGLRFMFRNWSMLISNLFVWKINVKRKICKTVVRIKYSDLKSNILKRKFVLEALKD